jgi:gamma-glutamylcyclotransferase (GGCT)/AIG2-like uncharacterized protein YtfP
MLYFAYGSNMSTTRLQQRVPSARPLSVALIKDHRLAFHKAGRDGSAKCDAVPTQQHDSVMYGVVFQIDAAHKPRLDAAEGLGKGYLQTTVVVRLPDGSEMSAFTYYATHIDPLLKPYAWYKEHVLRGATEHGLPHAYIEMIADIAAVEDGDPSRHVSELSIYRCKR